MNKTTLNELEIFNKYSTTIEGEYNMYTEEDKHCIVDTKLDNFVKDIRTEVIEKIGMTIVHITNYYINLIDENTEEGSIMTYDKIVELAVEFQYKKFPNEAWDKLPITYTGRMRSVNLLTKIPKLVIELLVVDDTFTPAQKVLIPNRPKEGVLVTIRDVIEVMKDGKLQIAFLLVEVENPLIFDGITGMMFEPSFHQRRFARLNQTPINAREIVREFKQIKTRRTVDQETYDTIDKLL